VPNLRVVLDHIPGITYRVKEYSDQTARAKFVADLKELGTRPNVYAKLSEVVRAVNGKVSTDLSTYKDWLDQMWDVFGVTESVLAATGRSPTASSITHIRTSSASPART
jgi:predicted TIM-barrel fold metal-dependent hydrolase